MKTQLTKDGEKAISCAKEAAREYGLGYVGTEHLLLGISQVAEGMGSKILLEHGANEYRLKAEIDRLVEGRMQETWVLGRFPGTPHFRDVLNGAADAARGSGNWRVGTEHLLLALTGETDSVGFKALQALGLTPDGIRKTLASLMAAH
jgi:ATP-dependent Clp protease ATP-binding subunit ClpC